MEITSILSTVIIIVIVFLYLVVSSFIQYKLAKRRNIYIGFIIPLVNSMVVFITIMSSTLFWVLTFFGFSYYLLVFFIVRNTKSLKLNDSTKVDLKDL